MTVVDIKIDTEIIQLDQFLKWVGAIGSGGEVKALLAENRIKLNGQLETARRRKLHDGDVVEIADVGAWRVVSEAE